MREVRDQLRRRLAVHPRWLEGRLNRRDRRLADVGFGCRHRRPSVVAQPPDAPVPGDLVELILLDLRAQVRTGTGPFPLLDDAVVHVGDVHRSIRSVADVHGPEQLIRARDELRRRIHVAQLRQPFDVLDRRPPDQPSDRLGKEKIALEIGRQLVAADDGGASRGGEVIQVLRRHARAGDAALHVADAWRGPDDGEVLLETVFHSGRAVRIRSRRRRRWSAGSSAARAAARRLTRRERAVVDRKLEVHRPALAARVDEPRLPIVIRRQAPLSAVRSGWLTEKARWRPTNPERVVGRVDPVVHVPQKARLLVLDVRVAALPDAAEDDFPLVGDAIAVGVAPLDQIVGVGLAREDDAVLQRQDHARRHELVDEDGPLVVPSIALRAFPAADAADRLVLAAGGGVHHVADHLADIHAAVAIELDERRADDVRLGGNELHAVPRWHHEARGFLFRCARLIRRFWREVRRGARLRAAAPAAAKPGRADGRARRLFCARARHLVLAVHDGHRRAQAGAVGRQREDARNRGALHADEVLEHQVVAGCQDVGDRRGRLAIGADRCRRLAAIGLDADGERRLEGLHRHRHEPVADEWRHLRGRGRRRRGALWRPSFASKRGRGAWQEDEEANEKANDRGTQDAGHERLPVR